MIPRRPRPSTSSDPPDADRARSTFDGHTGRNVIRKRRLASVVVVAIGGCLAILVAAVAARMSRPKAPAPVTALSSFATPTAAAPTADATTTRAAPAPEVTPPAVTTGNLVLVRPAVRGYVWLDGKKVTASSAVVACGPHQIKVGRSGRAHSVTVPCGGELKVWH